MNTTMTTIFLLLLAGMASTAPQLPPLIPIISQAKEGPNPDGSYQFSYETGDGKYAQEQGYLIYRGTPNEGQAAEGSYSYTAPNGEIISLQYLANDGGFQPTGDHLPTSPPIPPEIQNALQNIATQPQQV